MAFARSLVIGGVLGAVLLGAGGRLAMRLLALYLSGTLAFSWDGTLEIVAYGAIVGAVAGAGHAALPPSLRRRWIVVGVAWGLLTYAATVLTLPGHIAATAEPFAAVMPLVHAAFGACFLAFGLALSLVRRPRPPPQAASPENDRVALDGSRR